MAGGRAAEAARNDERVLATAHEVLAMHPDAGMAEVARRAGVGVASLYRRFPSRGALVETVCLRAMTEIERVARQATEYPDGGVPVFLADALERGAGNLRVLAGTFAPSAELRRAAASLRDAIDGLVEAARSAGFVRADLEGADLSLLLEQLASIRVGDPDRDAQLRRRALSLALPGLRPDGSGADALSVTPPTWAELDARWTP